jgi:protein involved in polysaccharide export with SLBB domain
MTKRKSRKIVAALSLAMVVAVAPATVLAGDYKLGISDKVKIKVQEWPDLAGEYTVSPDGVVSLPLIGNINVVGLNLNNLAREISDRLQRRPGGTEQTFAAVEIAQYRPFAILGDVQKPGQYQYRPGLTVLEAISIAGGYYRLDFGLLRLGRDVALATGDINTQRAKLNRLIAREARLSALLDGREDLPLPPELVKLKDDPVVSAIIKNEQAALALENEMKRTDRATFERIKSLYQNEIGSLRGQVEALSQEKESIGTQLNQLRAMAAKGLALSPTMFALERSFAQVSSEQMSAETAIVRANENITLAEQRMNQLQQERDHLNSKNLQQTRDELAEAHAKIETATLLLDEAQTGAPAEVRQRLSSDGERRHFIILRRDGDTTKQVVADETTFVAPDDVIKVPTVRPPPATPSSSINLSRADQPER